MTLWGVIYPLISEITQGETITVGQPFYNQVNGPIFLGIILLMGIAPFLPWRHASWRNIREALSIPLASTATVVILLIILGVNKIFPLISFGLCSLIATGILREWVRGTQARRRRGENLITAFTSLISGNRPRYGGYIAHLAIVLLALGITGSSFYGIQQDVPMKSGESVVISGYTIKYIGSTKLEKPDRIEMKAEISVSRGNKLLGIYYPRRDFYPSFNMSSTKAAIRTTAIEDLYIIPGEFLDDGAAIFRILINPLVIWMWIAGPILMLAVLVTLWPQRNGNKSEDNQ